MEKVSVYRQAAKDGVPFGIILTAVSLMVIYTGESGLAAIAAIILMMSLPFALFALMLRYVRNLNPLADIATGWTHGMMISLFGSLICGVVTYVWLQFFEPTFIYDQAESAIEAWKQLPKEQQGDMTAELQKAVDNGLLPTPIEFVVNMILLTTFLGSVLSLFMAWIIRQMILRKLK